MKTYKAAGISPAAHTTAVTKTSPSDACRPGWSRTDTGTRSFRIPPLAEYASTDAGAHSPGHGQRRTPTTWLRLTRPASLATSSRS